MNQAKKIPTDRYFVKRFKEKIEEIKSENGCWEWKWAKTSQGYGSVSYYKSRFTAHRVSFSIFKQNIPKNKVIDHICENRKCVNPEHLQITTMVSNIRLSKERNPGRYNRTRLPRMLVNGICKNGHDIKSFDDMYNAVWKGRNNYKCRACERVRKKTYQHNKNT